MRSQLRLTTTHLQLACLFLFTLSFGIINAQCVDNLKMISTEVSNNAPLCSYATEVCVDIMSNPVPDHVNIEINSSAGLFSQQIQSFGYINGKACTTFFLSNVQCGENISFSAFGYETPSFTSVCSRLGDNGGLAAPLAVEFAYFDGYKSRGDVVLEWVTLSEEDSDFFDVQVSKDGINYSTLDRVAAAGNSLAENAYQYRHENPFAGTNYYRLVQYDFDGSFIYSKVFATNIEATNEVHIFPTAVEDFVNVRIVEDIPGDVEVLVFNSIGNLMYQNVIPAGARELVIPTNELKSGYYFVKLELDGVGIITKPFIRKTL